MWGLIPLALNHGGLLNFFFRDEFRVRLRPRQIVSMPRLCRIFALAIVVFVAPEQLAQPGTNGSAPAEKRIYREVTGKKLELWIWKV